MSCSNLGEAIDRLLRYARELLADPQAQLSEIALLLGHFEQSAFRRWTGMSPVQYRRRSGP